MRRSENSRRAGRASPRPGAMKGPRTHRTEREMLETPSVDPEHNPGRATPNCVAPEVGHAIRVLLVDDSERNLAALEAMLGDLDATLVTARSGEEALRCLLQQDFALILLDVRMPGLDGFETAALIRSRDRSRHTPIIFLTAYEGDREQEMRGYALGAV